MTHFKWQIQEDLNHPIIKVQLITVPLQEPLHYFFSGIKLKAYPLLLQQVANKAGYGNDVTGITFNGDLDPTAPPFPEGMLEVYHHAFGEQLIEEQCFYQILQAFANQLLLTYKKDKNLSEKWLVEMKRALDRCL